MAMIVNKMLRVIPKKQRIGNVDCHSICINLAQTGGELHEKVIYYINEEENCLDIKYKSRKGRGHLGIEDMLEEFDIWTIQNYEGGSDYISCLNPEVYQLNMSERTNLYCFDEIRIKGNHKKLARDFYPNFFQYNENKLPNYLEKELQKEEKEFISLALDGIYNAGTIYTVGGEYSKIPELVTKEEFHRLRNVFYWEAEFLILHDGENYGLKKMLLSCLKDKFSTFEWDRTNLFEIQFCNKSRVVKKVETGKNWRYFNSEFFDNTIEKNWIDYLALWRRELI